MKRSVTTQLTKQKFQGQISSSFRGKQNNAPSSLRIFKHKLCSEKMKLLINPFTNAIPLYSNFVVSLNKPFHSSLTFL